MDLLSTCPNCALHLIILCRPSWEIHCGPVRCINREWHQTCERETVWSRICIREGLCSVDKQQPIKFSNFRQLFHRAVSVFGVERTDANCTHAYLHWRRLDWAMCAPKASVLNGLWQNSESFIPNSISISNKHHGPWHFGLELVPDAKSYDGDWHREDESIPERTVARFRSRPLLHLAGLTHLSKFALLIAVTHHNASKYRLVASFVSCGLRAKPIRASSCLQSVVFILSSGLKVTLSQSSLNASDDEVSGLLEAHLSDISVAAFVSLNLSSAVMTVSEAESTALSVSSIQNLSADEVLFFT